MPDITMCLSHDCEKKEQCYRYRADPSKYNQAYWDFKTQQDGECKFFQPLTQTVKLGEKFEVEDNATYEVRFIK